MGNDTAIGDFLACALRGEEPVWPETLADPANLDAMSQRISDHGISAILAELPLVSLGWPAGVTQPITEEARLQALWEASHHTAISALIEALEEQRVEALMLKGTALAYAYYAEPSRLAALRQSHNYRRRY